jgi:dolichol-phosphate hexosyltransferase
LPILDEEMGIERVLEELKAEDYENILVVDGYSSDRSAEIAKRFGVQVIQQHGSGKTGSILTAAEFVNTPYMLVMDGDFTYSAKDIERFLLHAPHYDEIIGSRDKGAIPASHRLGNFLITGLFNLLLGTKLSDVCSGMYLLSTKVARKLLLDSKGFDVEVEIAAQVSHDGLVTEVPISYRERIGKKKLSTWKDGWRILSSIFKLAHHYNPVFLFSVLAGICVVPGTVLLGYSAFEAFHGMSQILITIAGVGLLLFGGQALFVGSVSLLVKRSERRLSRQISSIVSPPPYAYALAKRPADEGK